MPLNNTKLGQVSQILYYDHLNKQSNKVIKAPALEGEGLHASPAIPESSQPQTIPRRKRRGL